MLDNGAESDEMMADDDANSQNTRWGLQKLK